MELAISCFVILNLIGTFAKSQNSGGNAADFVFLTFHNGSGNSFDVNIVTSSSRETANGPSLSLTSFKNGPKSVSFRSEFGQQFVLMSKSDPRASADKLTNGDDSLKLWQAKTAALSEKDGTLGVRGAGAIAKQLKVVMFWNIASPTMAPPCAPPPCRPPAPPIFRPPVSPFVCSATSAKICMSTRNWT
ncbi:hypothetical protein niasHT_010794 [Heterodera trifolii]|uniref:Legume lectin domain-containing protein n=1 Tax=Heterodera trifolii TaxID=157864 RepID=A0ABD2KVM7_9BILA